MIAVKSSDPSDAALAGLLDRQFRRPLHDQVTKSIIAVNERRSRSFVYNSNVRPRIDRAFLDLFHILRQAEHAMRISAARIGFGHQSGDLAGILWWNTYRHQRS